MSLSSFLTQAPVNYAQTASQTSSQLPSWYNDYTQGILANAAQFANQGYQAYPGPQVAGLTGDQQASYNTVRSPAGSAGVTGAQQGTAQAQQTLAGPNASQAASPYLGAAQQGINAAVSGPNASTAAQPYLNAAGQPLSQQMNQFMNPYINDVVNTSNQISARNFNQNVLPGLQDQFTQAGQVYGGSRQGVYAANLGAQENLNEQATDASLLSSGYNTALGGAEAQSNINAGLGSTAANAANAAQGNSLYGAGLTAGLGSTAGSLANASQQTGLSGAQTLGSLGSQQQAAALSQANAQNAMGTQQQQQTQNNYNTQYQNFQNEANFPATAAAEMGSALSGIQIPTSTTQYGEIPYGQTSTGLQNLAGGIGLGTQLGTALSPPVSATAARGGQIKRSPLQMGAFAAADRVNLATGGRPPHVSFLPNVRPILGIKFRQHSPLMTR